MEQLQHDSQWTVFYTKNDLLASHLIHLQHLPSFLFIPLTFSAPLSAWHEVMDRHNVDVKNLRKKKAFLLWKLAVC